MIQGVVIAWSSFATRERKRREPKLPFPTLSCRGSVTKHFVTMCGIWKKHSQNSKCFLSWFFYSKILFSQNLTTGSNVTISWWAWFPSLGSWVRIRQCKIRQAKGSHPHILNDKQKVFTSSWICPEKSLARTLCPPCHVFAQICVQARRKNFSLVWVWKRAVHFFPQAVISFCPEK